MTEGTAEEMGYRAHEDAVRTGTDTGEPFARISTGNAHADEILVGGFPANSISVVMGQPGTGKTVFAEQLVFPNAGGERPILSLTTLSEPLTKVVRYLQGFRFFDEAKLDGAVIYDDLGAEPTEQGIGVLVPRLKEAIKTVSPKIIAVDSFRAVHDLAPSVAGMRRIVFEVTGLLSAYGTTTWKGRTPCGLPTPASRFIRGW
jgi:circadian clock protein KaiC